MKFVLRAVLFAAALAATLSGGTAVHAQTYPTRPILLVVPYAAGTVTDSSARMLSTELSKRLGQPVVVQNQSGAVGTVGSQFVAKSPPDGYTLMITPPAPLTPAAGLPYDPVRAFVLIAPVTVPSDRSPVPISVYAPAGMPPEAVARIASALKDSLASASLQAQFATMGLQIAAAGQDGKAAVAQKPEQTHPAGSTNTQQSREDSLAAELKAANAGDASAMSKLGARYETGKGVAQNYDQAVAWYRKAANAGDIAGMSGLGAMYYNGWGVAKDPAQARIWISKAAAAGDGRAMNGMGNLYFNGLGGLPKDFAQALPWYEKAAAAGEPRAMFRLGSLYQAGQGVAQDYAQALSWYRKAADAGYAFAMYQVGNYYNEGLGVAKNDDTALSWYSKAADAGDADAMAKVGYFYEKGRSVAKNDDAALSWYRKAADAGSAGAMFNVGYYYSKGLGVAQNDGVALSWYRKAADAGNADAMSNIGFAYAMGRGVPQNNDESIAWYQKAAAKGQPDAIENLKRIETQQAANAASAPAAASSDSGDSLFANALTGALLSQTADALAQSNTDAGSVLGGFFSNLADAVQQGGSASSGASAAPRLADGTGTPGATAAPGQTFGVSRETREEACATSKSLTIKAGLVPGNCVCNNYFNAFRCYVETSASAAPPATGSTSAAGKLTTDQLHAIAQQCTQKAVASLSASGNGNNAQYDTSCKTAAFDLCIYQDTNHQVADYNQEAKAACSVAKSGVGGSACPSTCNAVAKLP